MTTLYRYEFCVSSSDVFIANVARAGDSNAMKLEEDAARVPSFLNNTFDTFNRICVNTSIVLATLAN